ncbi:MAG: nucleoside monophosphate kinase [archaeon]
MIIVFLGPPGSGKGTYAQLLAQKGWIHFSIGQAMREYAKTGGKYSEEIKKIQASGKLAPGNIFFHVFSHYVQKWGKKNVVLDGLPRTLPQAKEMKRHLTRFRSIDAYFLINVSEEEVMDRLSQRRQCEKCGEVYGTSQKPKTKGKCNRCGGKLIQRNDDKPSVIRERFRVYHAETEPVIEWAAAHYPMFLIHGHGSSSVVFKRIFRIISVLKKGE